MQKVPLSFSRRLKAVITISCNGRAKLISRFSGAENIANQAVDWLYCLSWATLFSAEGRGNYSD